MTWVRASASVVNTVHLVNADSDFGLRPLHVALLI